MKKRKNAKISKSQYVKGCQCPKALWLYRNAKELAPEIDEATQAIFDQGHEIGLLAQAYFKKGIEVKADHWDIKTALLLTKQYIDEGHQVIFEACALSEDGLYSYIDILKKVRGKDEWDLIEVKSSSSVKDYHLLDMASQRYAFSQSGYKVRKSILMHLNSHYYRQGELDLKKLFTLADCTKDVLEVMKDVPNNLESFKSLLKKKKAPEIEIGSHCSDPHECDYIEHCWKHVPDYSVYDVTSGKKLEDLLKKGCLNVKDIPEDFPLAPRKRMDVDSFNENKDIVKEDELKEWTKELKYPLYFLDYETISPAIPAFDNTKPYDRIPFQFSLHVQKSADSDLEHFEYLHTDSSDPRLPLTEALIKFCGKKGTVLVYNIGFEKGVNTKLAEIFTQYKKDLEAINERMIDLIVPFRARMLYKPCQQGSASIKVTLPAFCPEFSYDDLDVGDGMTASRLGQNLIQNRIPKADRDEVIRSLKEYCSQDTLAMVKLLEVVSLKAP